MTIVTGVEKPIPDGEAHAARLARMARLCANLDAVRHESERLYREITAAARRANAEEKSEFVSFVPAPPNARRLRRTT